MLRATITEKQHNELRKLALDKGMSTADLVSAALHTSPHTRKAFQAKENSK